jgi:hypothetical protein
MEIIVSGVSVLIDDEDYEKISKLRWYAINSTRGYSKRICTMKPTIYLHRYLLNAESGMEVDHINCNTLDNRKENLRICTHEQNTQNTKIHKDNKSGYKGVYYAKWAHKYRAEIQHFGKRVKLGYFDTAENAWLAYCKASKDFHGEYARNM